MVNMKTARKYDPTPDAPENWDHCDAAGHFINLKDYELIDSLGHPLTHGDVVYVVCHWLVSNSMQPAQIISGGSDRPIRVKLLRNAEHLLPIRDDRRHENNTLYIACGNIAYITDNYHGIDPDLTAALLYPREVPA